MTLKGARILSSANDASIKNEQNTNINIKFKQTPQNNPNIYPSIPTFQNASQLGSNVNFTQMDSQFPSVRATSMQHNSDRMNEENENEKMNYEIFEKIIEEKNKENEFLKLILQIYQSQPIIINSYVICQSSNLMNLITLLTDCDKVDFVLDDDIVCGGCKDNGKLIYISKILVTKNDKTTELKYGYNEAYSRLVANGISLKIVL